MSGESKRVFERAIREYNRYRSPEAKASLIEFRGEEALVKVSGTFCQTCGLYDWLEDLIYEALRIDEEFKAEIKEWKQVSDDTVLVTYKLPKRPTSHR